MKMLMHKKQSGFTLIEIMLVVGVLAILAVLSYGTLGQRYKSRAYYTRAVAELNSMGNAAQLYVAKNNDYPADVVRDIPSDLKSLVQGQEGIDAWPKAPWPGSVYDYENWPPDSYGPQQTYQISIRFCDVGDSTTCKALAKKYLSDYASASILDNWDSQSAVYYCLKGSCRSHQSKPISHPGYCINCGTNKNQGY